MLIFLRIFFSRGGNSFALIEMNSRLKDELDIDIELIKLFEYPTIKALAAYIESIHAPKEAANKEDSEQNKTLKKKGYSEKNNGCITEGDRMDTNNLTGLEVAVIGIAGKFPGAKDIDSLWKNLVNGERINYLFLQ